MSRLKLRPAVRPLLCLAVLGAGAAVWAGAQVASTRLSLLGRSVPSVTVAGAEYVRDSALGSGWQVAQAGQIVRVSGYGHTLLLPIDQDQQRAGTDFNTVQIDTDRVQAATATLVNGNLYLPLNTLARALGAQYQPGRFALPSPQLQGVSSRAGREIDRVVLDLNRNVNYSEALVGGKLQLRFSGTGGGAQTYGTRGKYLPKFSLSRDGADLLLSASLPAGAGYRSYTSARAGAVRVILDVGPGLPLEVPALFARLRKPLIVIDPAAATGGAGDLPLELARQVGELLAQAGWRVKLTRSGSAPAPLAERQSLARQSDLYVGLDLGRFPQAGSKGVTLFEPAGQAGAEIINRYRQDEGNDPLVRATVGTDGDNRRFSDLVRGELSALDLNPRRQPGTKLLMLREAPHAALGIEFGWPQNPEDRARLADPARSKALATALARSVATFLAAKVNKAGT